ncbi:DUF6503 domain-containing protein [Zobellia roscoffensis]|uniref:DUF6503 family protein n=1 Tax=Zobellia roscoffensis TaxID=2779508 RepID=UPI00188ADC2C|nr:DUF6503 family protein [Zobellia roscoffensis]
MKIIVSTLVILTLLSCKEATKKDNVEPVEAETEITRAQENNYPEALIEVFDAHGGLKNFKSKRTLTFEIVKPSGNETHTVDLYSRKDKIEIPPVTLGFNGKDAWLLDKQKAYKGNAALYHNLMFYFYAMPFVLADPGIKYEVVEDLEYEGKNYPGIYISYNDGVGASSKDDYYLYYDSESHEMAWLAYTFTFGTDEKSDKLSFIRYNDWEDVDGVKLPKSITWHVNDGKTIKEPRKTVVFENSSLHEGSKPDAFYAVPGNAKVILKP